MYANLGFKIDIYDSNRMLLAKLLTSGIGIVSKDLENDDIAYLGEVSIGSQRWENTLISGQGKASTI